MRLIKYQEVDLAYLHKSIEKTLVENLSRAYYDHVLGEMLVPGLLVPEVHSHAAKEVAHALVNVIA
jgi:hypothetical protein